MPKNICVLDMMKKNSTYLLLFCNDDHTYIYRYYIYVVFIVVKNYILTLRDSYVRLYK